MNVDTLDPSDIDAVRKRLRRVEGQIRGLERSLEGGGDCRLILRQFTAASNALRSAGMVLALTAFESCVDRGEHADVATLRKALLAMS